MYGKILKKDLKRKTTMNVILFIFIALAATFISSSANNLYSITTAMETYFQMAGLPDYLIMTLEEKENDEAIINFLKESKSLDSWEKDEHLYCGAEQVLKENGKKIELSDTGIISSFDLRQQKFFDSEDKEITKIKSGEIYLPLVVMNDNHLVVGDQITIKNGTTSMKFTIVGNCKDAYLGSALMGAKRFIMNPKDYEAIKKGGEMSVGRIYYIETKDVDTFEKEVNKEGFQIIVACDQSLVSITYVMDMVIAGILTVVSVCLILISFVILRFTIMFTLQEEFREIGIMKAIGVKSRKIRGIYVIKYFAIAVLGSLSGFLAGIPFGRMFLRQVSANVIISGNHNSIFISAGCCVLVVGIVMLFSYTCTMQINRFSAIDAIRNGSQGERYCRKGILGLKNSRLSVPLFLAVNDIAGNPRRFLVLLITFIMGIILIIVPVNSVNTLKSDQLVKWFSMAESDLYLTNEEQQTQFIKNDREYMIDYLDNLEEELKEKGVDATVFMEVMHRYHISAGDNSMTSLGCQGTGVSTDQYSYLEGTAPAYEDEVALTHLAARKLGVTVGDTVQIKVNDEEKKFTVTAIYQSMSDMGIGIRFSEKTELNYTYAIAVGAVQVNFNGNLSDREKAELKDKISDWYPEYKVQEGGSYINFMMGNVAGQMDDVKWLIVLVVIAIDMLVAVLMVKSFITREKGEIGMMKSLGFSNGIIVRWQAVRIGIVLLLSTILGTLLAQLVSQISSGQIFKMMGASQIDFVIRPLEVYLFYPMITLLATMAASMITALQVRKIQAWETNKME